MSETTTKYTAADALKALNGISKKRLYEMMNNGDISYETEEWGSGTRRIIDGSELARVYGNKFTPKETTDTELETKSNSFKKPSETAEIPLRNNPLQVEVEVLRERIKDKENLIADKDKTIEDLRGDRNEWKKQAQTLLLQSPQKPVEGKENISGEYVAKNQNKLSSGQIWAIVVLFLIAILISGAGQKIYSELKPQSPPESKEIIPEAPKKPIDTPVFIPRTPLNYSPPAE